MASILESLWPDSATARFWQGFALQRAEDVDGAIDAYRKAIEIHPEDASAHGNLGALLAFRGDLDEAIEVLERATSLWNDPRESAKDHVQLGKVLFRNGQRDEAIQSCRTAIALDPDSAAAHAHLGALLDNESAEALAALTRAIELDPNSAFAHYNLGVVLLAQERLGDAAKHWRRTIELNPEIPEAHANLAVVLRTEGRIDEAIRSLEQALELNPRLEPAHSQLLEIYAARGPSGKSWQGMLNAIEEHPEHFVPANGIRLAAQAHYQGFYVASASLYARAFDHHNVGDGDLVEQNRYAAACSATLAGVRGGNDGHGLSDEEAATWRQRALDWLQKELASYLEQHDAGTMGSDALEQKLIRWRTDPDLYYVRVPRQIELLPDREREPWHRFWTRINKIVADLNRHP
jgi:tetratricopeptide (TPR) repeat protein